MSSEVLSLIVAPVVTALLAWLLARAKNRQEIIRMRTENEMQAAKYYQDLLDDMSERLNNSIREIDVLMQHNKELLAANQKLMETNRDLVKTNQKLITTNRNLVAELQKFKQLNGKPKQ